MGVFCKVLASVLLVGLAVATKQCNHCTVSDGTHTFDLSTIPFAGPLEIKQTLPEWEGPYSWSFSLCTPQLPAHGETCFGEAEVAFVYEYGKPIRGRTEPRLRCFAMTGAVAPWRWNTQKQAATRTFNSSKSARANIEITCDPAADTLAVNGDAEAKWGYSSGFYTWTWTVKLKSKAVCAPPAPGPAPTLPALTPAPSPPPVPASGTPAPSIAPAPGPYGFLYCGAVAPAQAEVRGQTTKTLAVVDGVGSRVMCPCLTVASNTEEARRVELSIACAESPDGPFATVQDLPKMAGYSATAPVTAECPVRGYFAVVAWNPSGTTAELDYGAKCVVLN